VELANRRWELEQCGLCNLAKVELANRRWELGQCGLHNLAKWSGCKIGEFAKVFGKNCQIITKVGK